jgi:hypothetical protein
MSRMQPPAASVSRDPAVRRTRTPPWCGRRPGRRTTARAAALGGVPPRMSQASSQVSSDRARARRARPRRAARRGAARPGWRACRRRGGRPPCSSRGCSAPPCTGTAWCRERASMSSMVKSTPASWAAARMCSTVLVEPPIAHVEAHGVLERGLGGDRARQHRGVVLVVVPLRPGPRRGVRPPRTGPCGRTPSPASSRCPAGEAERLGEAVHRVGGEHARTRTARRAGRALDGHDLASETSESTALIIASIRSRRVPPSSGAPETTRSPSLARLHGPAGDEHGRGC